MSKATVLIVEDEAIVATDLTRKLQRLGYEICGTAVEGEEAIALASSLRPSLVLMDIRLEGSMDGIEAAEAIRNLLDVPVIYLTALSDPATLERAKITGPFGYILKPFEERELATQIELAIYKHQADRQLREQREWLRVTLTSIGDAVIATDADGHIVFMNPVAEALTGWKSDEATGRPLLSVFRVVNEKTGEGMEDPVTRVFREGHAVPLANHAALVTRDGYTVPIEDSAAPIKDATGKVIGVVLVFQDVTERRRTEEMLSQAHEFTRAILDTVDGLIIVLDRHGSIVRFNAACERLTGWQADEVIGRCIWEFLVPEEQRAGVLETFGQLTSGSFPNRHENDWVLRDGSRRWISWANSAMMDSSGSVEYVIGTGIDISERKKAERALRLSEERLRLAKEAAGLGIHDYDIASGTINWDDRVRELWGVGADDPITYEVFMSGLHPDDRAPTQAAVDGALDPKGSGKYYAEYRVVPLSGGLQHWVAATGQVFFEADRPVRLVGTVKDITGQKQKDEALRQSELRFRLLSETAGQLLTAENPQGIVNELCQRVMEHLDCHAFFNFLVDEKAGKLRLNACTGIPDEEAGRIEWLDFGVAVCGNVALRRERIVAEDIFHYPNIQTDLVRSYGIQAYACHPLMAGEKLIGTLSFGTKSRTTFSQDDLALMKTVTDQVAVAMERMRLVKELEKSRDDLEHRVQERTAELLKANEALDEFASIASHDMQEPLRKILSFGDHLRAKCGDSLEDAAKDYLDRMQKAARRMQSLLTALLDYSRVSRKSDHFTPVDLSILVSDVLDDLEVRIHQTGGKVEMGELPAIEADPNQMRQLFQNLIGNGLKYHGKERPVVKVYAEPAENGAEWRIIIEDNGIGFDQRHADRIFAPFQRLHGKSSQYEGTGMGLAICKKIVERHGGTITAKSSPGEGTSFIITLPGTPSPDVN